MPVDALRTADRVAGDAIERAVILSPEKILHPGAFDGQRFGLSTHGAGPSPVRTPAPSSRHDARDPLVPYGLEGATGRCLLAQPGCAPIDVRLPVATAGRALLIGRARACDLVVDHESVSRRHAELVHDGSRWLLRDLGSTNGTWDGDWRVIEIEIDAGSELRLGGALVRFRA